MMSLHSAQLVTSSGQIHAYQGAGQLLGSTHWEGQRRGSVVLETSRRREPKVPLSVSDKISSLEIFAWHPSSYRVVCATNRNSRHTVSEQSRLYKPLRSKSSRPPTPHVKNQRVGLEQGTWFGEHLKHGRETSTRKCSSEP